MSETQMQSGKSFPIYVAGSFQETASQLKVISPYSGECVYQTFLGGDAEFETAVDAACSVRVTMRDLPVYERYQILMEIADQLQASRDELAQIMSGEAGKPIKVGVSEVDRAIQTFTISAEEAKRLPGEVMSIDWTDYGSNKDAIIKYFPVGVVAGISPFNFPLNLVAHKIAPAIAAGCPIVLKPASKTPIAALFLAGIIDKTRLPKGALSVIPMDRVTGNRLVTDSRFNLLSFTGSPDIGWKMKKEAGKKKVVLELGGNAALIVSEDADLDRVVPKSVTAAFSFSGQTCIHTQRIYVEQSIFDDYVTRFETGIKQLRIGDPRNSETDFSVMIDEKNAKRIESWVVEAEQQGAKVIYGGTREGSQYAPTVLTNTNRHMKVCALEAFAPIVIIEPYTDFKEAIAAVNDSEFGLQTGIFSHDSRKIHYAFQNLEVGGVMANEVPSFRADHMPYGGVKDSGLGREGPKYTIHDLMEPKILVMDHSSDF